MKHAILGGVFAGLSLTGTGAVVAQDLSSIPAEKLAVLTCVETMKTDEDWGQCLTQMFAPCAEFEVGRADHVSCLFTEREEWRVVFDGQFEVLTGKLNAVGAVELGNLVGQWTGYVGNKCNAVASTKEGSFADASQYGCEISEIVGISAELMACEAGVSTAPYCVLKD